MDAYIYQAALLCDGCGEKIVAELTRAGKAPEDPEDEHTYDSDDFPKGPYSDGGGESDSPQHCDQCNGFLENPLTTDGYNYVKEAVAEDLKAGRKGSVAVTEWAPFYDIPLEQDESIHEASEEPRLEGQWRVFFSRKYGMFYISPSPTAGEANDKLIRSGFYSKDEAEVFAKKKNVSIGKDPVAPFYHELLLMKAAASHGVVFVFEGKFSESHLGEAADSSEPSKSDREFINKSDAAKKASNRADAQMKAATKKKEDVGGLVAGLLGESYGDDDEGTPTDAEPAVCSNCGKNSRAPGSELCVDCKAGYEREEAYKGDDDIPLGSAFRPDMLNIGSVLANKNKTGVENLCQNCRRRPAEVGVLCNACTDAFEKNMMKEGKVSCRTPEECLDEIFEVTTSAAIGTYPMGFKKKGDKSSPLDDDEGNAVKKKESVERIVGRLLEAWQETELPDGILLRNGSKTIRVEPTAEGEKEDYEVWYGDEETGAWDSIGFEKDYEKACTLAREHAKENP